MDIIADRNQRPFDIAQKLTLNDLREATNQSIDAILALIADLDDVDVTFNPYDPEAHDPFAVPGEEHIGWSIAHLVTHVTASSEEGAAFSSLLARGIPAKERPRYETPWREITTKAQCVQRLQESRRIRLAYLDTWPDVPHLNVYREFSERFVEKFGPLNAPASFIFGLRHELGHMEQMRAVKQQALEAKQNQQAKAL
jgi:hypothetical protein